MDALPYSLVDSVIGVWLINLITGARHVMMVVRKKIVCACGCRGWCTYHGMLLFIHWVLECLAKKRYPNCRHDNTPFHTVADAFRINLAGLAMKTRGAILKLKGDWQEFCDRFGFPIWQSGLRPCFCCNAFTETMFVAIGVLFSSTPWHE